MPMKTAGYTIGKLARAAGVNVETVRYYQRLGLIREPAKPAQGHRRYSNDTVARLRFIRRAQRLGFTLKEVAELLSLEDGKCKEARGLAEEKRAVVDSQISDLSAMRRELERLIRACNRSGGNARRCALIDTLTHDGG
jgi:MerR family transcriptional regulator, mercuric resistance operon regulatory protein